MTSRSGRSQTEAQRSARGLGRLALRMATDRLDELAELADFVGLSRAEYLSRMIEKAWADRSKALPGNRT